MFNILNAGKMKTAITILLILGNFVITNSQTNEVPTMKNWELIGFGKSAERIGDYYSAIDYYSEYYKRNKKNDKISYKLANLYFDVKNFQKAKPIFLNLYNSGKDEFSKSLFKYGQILKIEEKYDSAKMCFEIYRDNYLYKEDVRIRDYYLLKVKHEIESCEPQFQDTKKNINIQALNSTINKVHKELSPLFWNDTVLIYSSLVIDSLPVIKINQKTNLPVTKFYAAKYINGQWEGGYAPPKPFFNYDNVYSSDGVFSDDNKRFYFTISKENKKGKRVSALYVSKYVNGKWQNPKKMDKRINIKNYFSSQPTIGKCYNKNYDVVYFVSDRPGGMGGADIWYTIYDKQTGKYKNPVNAGSYINTPGNEITPYFENSTKTMYYSSDGLPGYGGYDIYKTIGELVNWIPSTNIGLPINSPYDDIYFTHFKNDTLGFVVSNRSEAQILKNPNCCYDIFQYKITNKKNLKITGKIYESKTDFTDIITKKGEIINKKHIDNKKTPSIAKIELHIENKNNNEYILVATDTTTINGSFNFKVDENQNYILKIIKTGFISTKIKFNTHNKKDKLIVINPVTIIPIQKKPISLNNIYFEFNNAKLTEGSKKYIDSSLLVIMKKYKNIVVEISAHTDGIGSENYNLELSAKRAQSVENYLVANKVEKVRIITKGYGESKPIAPEYTKDGLDNPKGREKNRRVEFRVVGILINEKSLQ